MADDYLVTVIVPTMNEEESIGLVMDQINSALRSLGKFEVLVVDTNSKDRTREIARSKGARIIDEPRRGYGRAYKTGFAHANGKFIATLDADCTYPASDIPRFVKMLEAENLDFITGDRLSAMEKGVMSKKHMLGNWMLKTATNILFSMNIADSQSGMWVFRRSVLERFDLVSDKMALSEEIKIEAAKKCRFKEVPIKYSPRKGEVKLNTWRDGYGNMKFLFGKRFGKAGKATGK